MISLGAELLFVCFITYTSYSMYDCGTVTSIPLLGFQRPTDRGLDLEPLPKQISLPK